MCHGAVAGSLASPDPEDLSLGDEVEAQDAAIRMVGSDKTHAAAETKWESG